MILDFNASVLLDFIIFALLCIHAAITHQKIASLMKVTESITRQIGQQDKIHAQDRADVWENKIERAAEREPSHAYGFHGDPASKKKLSNGTT